MDSRKSSKPGRSQSMEPAFRQTPPRSNSLDQQLDAGPRRAGRRVDRRNSANGVNSNDSFANSYRTSVINVSKAAARYTSEEKSESESESNTNATSMGLARYLHASSRSEESFAAADMAVGRNGLGRNKSSELAQMAFGGKKNSLQQHLSGNNRVTAITGNLRRSRSLDDSSDLSDASLSVGGVLGNTSFAVSQSSRVGNSSGDLSNPAFMSLMHQSSVTLPTANMARNEPEAQVKLKKEQLIESVVWFSFHTPKTVMEDLITHELEVWRSSTPVKSRQTRRGGKRKVVDRGEAASVNSMDDTAASTEVLDSKKFSENLMKLQHKGNHSFMQLPKSVPRESALLFVDMSGFTRLSTMLDAESLSKVINAYFDMIVSEVIQHGGDILKFAGDAFFAEWRVVNEDGTSNDDARNPLENLNASLASVNEFMWDDGGVPKLSTCVLMAVQCACSIVAKFSDFHVTSASTNKSEAMLNVHCGVGVGKMVGLHVGDFKEDQDEEDAIELRREFLILGEPIEQVSIAADVANDGEVVASPEAMSALAHCVDLSDEQRETTKPILIASRSECYLDFSGHVTERQASLQQNDESLRVHCSALNNTALARLHLQMALYVHPVIRGDELALSASIQSGKISQPTATLESRHRAEAELRSVFTMFINALIIPKVTGVDGIDSELHQKLHGIMHVTSRELDRWSGHLRQFIVDDKGVVLIATFGLRGSTFPNMVANNALPAAFAINRCLRDELSVDNRIGCTFGKVYCGVVGGIRRHEFSVLGAPINLAARLMCSKENRGILVDEAVQQQAGDRFPMNTLQPIQAKGYDKPVTIFEPLNSIPAYKKKKSAYPFIGRKEEKRAIMSVADYMLDNFSKSRSSMVFLQGESGMGKSALATSVVDEIKESHCTSKESKKIIISARSTSNETEQRIPLSSFRQVFLSMIRDLCEYDGSLQIMNNDSEGRSASSRGSGGFGGLSGRRQNLTLSRGRSKRFSGVTAHAPSLSRSSHASRQQSSHGTVSSTSSSDEKRPSLMVQTHNQRFGQNDFNESTEFSTTETDHTAKSSTFKNFVRRGSLSASRRFSGKLIPGLSQSNFGEQSNAKTDALSQSLHQLRNLERSGNSRDLTNERPSLLGASLHKQRSTRGSLVRSTVKSQSGRSMRGNRNITDESTVASVDSNVNRLTDSVPYFEKLCWVCEQLDYPFEYADIVGSQFLGLDSANPVTHVDGHVPTMDELADFLSHAFVCVSDFADLAIVVLDDFQWTDTFSWKIFRALCKACPKMLLICATRSHDKQALRRLSAAISEENDLHGKLTEISLGPLDFGDIRDLVALILDVEKSTISEGICTDIFQRTGGLPVYVVQTMEHIKRNKTLESVDGVLKWNADGLREKRNLLTANNAAVMEETFLSRFDSLDIRVRKVLQTCAVLGLEFALTDVIQVHPEMSEIEIENSLDLAVDEMILVEHNDDDETISLKSLSISEDEHTYTSQSKTSRSHSRNTLDDRYFQFSHAMWRNNVLTTMLKERKYELHRLIAETMEGDQILVLEQSNISRLLTIFEHWKACGDFCKAAPLALAVGARLEEWDLSAQSLELYEDALELSFESIFNAEEEKDPDSEWIQVKAKPMVLDLILRLHICVGLCHQRLGDPEESIFFFEDAYSIIKSASKIPGMSKALMMPIISSLCVLKLDAPETGSSDDILEEQAKLVETLLYEANLNGHPVHICRALSIKASHEARLGNFDLANECVNTVLSTYDIASHGPDMVAEYGTDFAMVAVAESVQWLYLAEEQELAEQRADYIMDELLPQVDMVDIDDTMLVVLPLISVLMLVDRSKDADWLLKKYVINPYHESGQVSFWSPVFNPLAYVLELILMEESEQYDTDILEDLEAWVMDEESSKYDIELERRAHTLMGELCWRLAYNKEEGDPGRRALLDRATDLLTPIARYPHPDVFLRHTARALLEAM